MKFGGTSVGSIERIQNVARIVKTEVDAGHEVAVCVSAMSGETNRLVDLCRQTGSLFDLREYDTVVSTGEQVTVGLLAMTLQSMGVDARSWLGWQMPFRTEDARKWIGSIETAEIERRFQKHVKSRLLPASKASAIAGASPRLAAEGQTPVPSPSQLP